MVTVMILKVLFFLVIFHGADGEEVEVNPDQVTSIRAPREKSEVDKLLPKTARCLINMADGKFVAVREDCAEVRRAIEEVMSEPR
jgi:hypothetical protein